MKTTIIMIAFVSLMAIKSSAQNTEAVSSTKSDNRENLYFGIKAGANYSNVYDSQGENFVADAKYGFAGGVFVSIPIGKFFGIQPEVLYSQRGYKSSGTFFSTPYNLTRTTDFIDVPLLVAIKPIEFVSILFGPQFSFLVRQKDEFTGGGLTSTQEQTYTNDNLRKNLFCLTGGADINLESFVIGLRAGWDTTVNNGDGTSTTPRYKNVWYQATVGFRF